MDWKSNQQAYDLIQGLTWLKSRSWTMEDVQNLEKLIATGADAGRKAVEE